MKFQLKHFCPRLATFFASLLFALSAHALEVHLKSHDYAPYHLDKNGKLVGPAADVVQCAFDKAQIKYRVEIAPHGEHVLEVINGKADGFFVAQKNADRDKIGVASAAVGTTYFSWILREGLGKGIDIGSPESKEKLKVAALPLSASAKWLSTNGYKNISEVLTSEQQIGMLKTGRIDALLVNLGVISVAAKKLNIDMKAFPQIHHSENTFHVYMSHEFLKKNPNFYTKLNPALDECRKDCCNRF